MLARGKVLVPSLPARGLIDASPARGCFVDVLLLFLAARIFKTRG